MIKEILYVGNFLKYIQRIFDKIFFDIELNHYFLKPLILNMDSLYFEYVLHRTKEEKKSWLYESLGFDANEVEKFLHLYEIYGDYNLEADYLDKGILYINVCLEKGTKEENLSYNGFGIYEENSFILYLNNNSLNITSLSLYCDLFILGYDLILDSNIQLYIVSNKYNISVMGDYALLRNYHINLNEDLSKSFLDEYMLCYLTNAEDLLRCNLNKFSKIIMNNENINIEDLFKKYNVKLDNRTLIFYCSDNILLNISLVKNYLSSLTQNSFLNIEIYVYVNRKTYDYFDNDIINKFGKFSLHTPCSNILLKGE